MIHALPMVNFVLLEEDISMRVEWKSATTSSGEQSVVIHGTQEMLVWLAGSLVTQDLVSFILVSSVRIETLYTCMLSYTYCESKYLNIFVAGVTAYSYSYFGRGNGSIYLSNIGCRGSESRLMDCYHRGIGIHYCHHYYDAGLRCKRKATILSHTSSLYKSSYRRM